MNFIRPFRNEIHNLQNICMIGQYRTIFNKNYIKIRWNTVSGGGGFLFFSLNLDCTYIYEIDNPGAYEIYEKFIDNQQTIQSQKLKYELLNPMITEVLTSTIKE